MIYDFFRNIYHYCYESKIIIICLIKRFENDYIIGVGTC